ncbi:MAG: hypothetical protein HYV63_06550 [Candidatus Schekmanbacteria bacterium]|nr:hypothetical protein [Candidatus Schekmanbacteria bacterium]
MTLANLLLASRLKIAAAAAALAMALGASTAAFATVPCIAFVHGHRADSSLTTDSAWSAGSQATGTTNNYWYEGPGVSAYSDSMFNSATNGYAVSYALINYNSLSYYYYDAAKEVADNLNSNCQSNSWIVSHSEGGRVVAFIMGNAVSGDPYYNYGGHNFAGVRSRYNTWFAIAAPLDGTAAAESLCGNSSWSCDAMATVYEWFSDNTCDNGTKSLQHNWAPQWENGSRVSTYLVSGYEAMVTSGCLEGEDDGVIEYASSFFCNDHPDDSNSVGYDRFCSSLEDVETGTFDGCGDNPSNKCKGSQKQRTGYKNYDAGHETHNDNRSHLDRGDNRRAVADGYWSSSSCYPITDDSCDFGWSGSAASEIGWFVSNGSTTP